MANLVSFTQAMPNTMNTAPLLPPWPTRGTIDIAREFSEIEQLLVASTSNNGKTFYQLCLDNLLRELRELAEKERREESHSQEGKSGTITKKTKMNDTNPVDDNIPMSNLDEELIASIIDYLRPSDIENFTNICKTWGSRLSVSLLKPVQIWDEVKLRGGKLAFDFPLPIPSRVNLLSMSIALIWHDPARTGLKGKFFMTEGWGCVSKGETDHLFD